MFRSNPKGPNTRGSIAIGQSRSKRAKLLAASAVAGASLGTSVSSAVGQALQTPTFGSTVYNVTVSNASINGGVAASTGSSDNATAINAYINYCSTHGGGTVEIPAGTFNSNKITLTSNVNLEIDSGGVLMNATPANTLITASGSNLNNIEISGGGIINGGATTATSSNNLVDIRSIHTLEITNVTIENAEHEHLVPESDSNVTIDHVTIADPGTLATNGNNYLGNTDAIDYSGSNFTIQNCNINAGDDDIVAKASSTFCSNILIQNCYIGAGHGISVGGGVGGGLSNMNVNNVTFNGTDNGLRLKAEDSSANGDQGGGTLHPLVNVNFSNIVMTNVANPLIIDSFYNGGNNFPSSPTQTNHAADSTTPMWENVGFNNVVVTGASNDGLLYDLNTTPQNLTGLSFNNVSITGGGGMNMWWGSNINLTGLTLNHTNNQQDLTNVIQPGTTSITWNNSGASVGGQSLGNGTTWDITGNQNWNTGTFFTAYTNNSNVTFNDTNNGHYGVTLNTTVSPVSTTINNSVSTYTISGTGMIAGTGALTKSGASTAIISTSNTYSGGTTINGGTLTVASANALGAAGTTGLATGAKPGATTVNANGALDLGGQSIVEPITLNGGTLTNSSASAATVVGGVKGVGYTTTTAGIAAGSTITFGSGSAAAAPVFGITAASFGGFTGTYTAVSGGAPQPQLPLVIITSSDGKGSGAMGYAVLTGNNLTSVVITNPGSGYDAAPVITFSGGHPTVAGSATGNANNFAIVGMQMTNNGSGYTSAPTATLQNNGGPGAATLTSVIGSVNLASTSSIGGSNGDISLPLPVTGAGGLTKIGTDTVTLGAADSYAGTTTVNAGTLLVAASGALPGGPVSISNGTVQLGASTGLANVSSLSISGSGTFDVNNNHVMINYGAGADPASSILALLATGYNNGAWNGAGGITSSAIASNPGYALGFADSSDPSNPAGLAAGTAEIAFTLIGDADLNGVVNGIDFGILAANFNQTVTSWDQGDFDYNGIVNGLDFTNLAANFNKAASSAADIAALDAFAAANGLLADVPEPASIAFLAIATGASLARRRRRNS
jgi:autotransporter-associated beta strand protein